MEHLITASECCKKLGSDLGYVCKKDYFSKLVSEGKFTTHKKPNSPKKWFKYEEVEAVVKTFARVAQAEAAPVIAQEKSGLFGQVGKFSSVADMSKEEIQARFEAEAAALREAREQAAAAGVDIANPINKDEEAEDGIEFFGKTLNGVKIQKEFWLGKKAEIEYKRQMNEVVSIEEVNRNAFEVARLVRDSLGGMSARLTSMLITEDDPHVIRTLIDEEVNRTLTSVSESIYG